MADIKTLREEMATIATQARAKFDEITDDTPAERTAEIETEFDKMMADHDAIGSKVERLKRLEAAEERAQEGDDRRPRGENTEAEAEERGEAPKYKDVFIKSLREGVSSLSDAEKRVMMAARQEVPQEVRAQATGTDAAGGYVVPQEFSGEIDKAMAAWGPMWDANVVRELNTSNGREIDWPTVDDTANTGRIKAENASVDDDGTDDVVFGEKKLNAYVYDTGMVRVPIELLQDSAFDIESLMNDLFGERLGRLANTALTTGTGSSQPNGIATAATSGVTAASATLLASDELIDLLHSVDPAYRASPQCRWQFNDSTMAAIRKLKDGDGNYLWQMGDVRTGEPDRILAHPYSVNQAMPSIATGTTPILFGDHSRYVVRKVMGFQVMTLRERYAENFQVGMVGFKRFDGELLNTAAVKKMTMA